MDMKDWISEPLRDILNTVLQGHQDLRNKLHRSHHANAVRIGILVIDGVVEKVCGIHLDFLNALDSEHLTIDRIQYPIYHRRRQCVESERQIVREAIPWPCNAILITAIDYILTIGYSQAGDILKIGRDNELGN